MADLLSRAFLIRLVFCLIVLWAFSDAFLWATADATWRTGDPEACTGGGACWGYIGTWWDRFIYGSYPETLRWRPQLAALGLILAGASAVLFRHRMGYRSALAATTLAWILCAVLLRGGVLGLATVDLNAWGGALLTVTIAFTAMLASMLLGIPLAFARLSDRPVFNLVARLYIEFWRAVPLVMVLFVAVSLMPLFLPYGMEPKRLISVLIAFSLYYSAYMAEAVRAGVQALPRGQQEAAFALGLSKWRSRDLVIIPQAIRLALPTIVNILIAVLKDTTLVLIIGMFDLLGMVQQSLHNPAWGHFALEGYLFVAGVMWVLCFTLSRVSTLYER